MTQKIVQSGQVGPNLEEAAEIARKKGMAKGTAGAAEAGSEYEQGTVLRRFYLETMKSFSLLAFMQINCLLFIIV